MTLPLLLVLALYAVNPITLSLSGAAVSRGQAVRALATVPRHADNRRLCFTLHRDGLQDYLSCDQLAGELAKVIYWRWWNERRPLPAGDYTASAVLTRMEQGKEKRYTDSREFRVIGMDGSSGGW